MKIRKHRLSLAVGILAILLGGGLFLLLALGMDTLPEAVLSAFGTISGYIGIGSGAKALMPFGIFFFLEGLVLLLFRRKKRFSMYLSAIFLALIYMTVLVYQHRVSGNSFPEAIVSRIGEEDAWLLIVCAALEAVLFFVLMLVSGKADSRLFDREEKRNRRIELQERKRSEAVADNDEETDGEEVDDLPPRTKAEEKEDRRYMKMKARMEKKRQKKEERLAAKDRKRFERFQEKENRKAEKQAEKARAAEEKARKKEAASLEATALDDSEDSFLTKGAPAVPRRHIDPAERVEVPEVGDVPKLKTIRQREGVRMGSVKEPDRMPPESDVFAQIKEEIEREEESQPSQVAEYNAEEAPTFRKGGMIEATLEAMKAINESVGKEEETAGSNTSPIIGYSDKTEKKERKNNSSFAPSGLSPDHPRYKLFESLTHQRNVSSFPSKSFEAEVPDSPSEYGSTFIKEEEKRIPGQSGFLRQDPSDEEEEEIQVHAAPAKTAPRIEKAPIEESIAVETASVKADDEEVEIVDDEREMPSQENELMLSVGISGLQSNELGFAAISQRTRRKYIAPPLNILVDYPQSSSEIDDFTRHQGDLIIETLRDYHVDVTMDGIIKGPTVTMYQLKLGEAVPVQRVKSRADELSYNLGGARIRILAPIPGRKAIGIEVPNKSRAIIGFKDMLHAYRKGVDPAKLRVPMILGRTITGEPITIDVAKMPHMLVAGTTGSGKSVCINSFICTLLYTRSPQDVRLIMVDPKVVELTVYNGIPHLLTPVITEAKKVVKALGWLCDEMERRYQMISKFGVRNIEGLNARIRNENIPAEKLPYIVLIMDEFADLMSTVGKDIETYVARLAAKARAAGIHLILATQRPSSDVITGTIKNNFPARIAFAVSSATNSRIILDEGGAENLLGKGDMLLMEPSTMGFQRIQGAFLSDDEVYSIVDFARKHGTTDYLADDIFEDHEAAAEDGEEIPVSEEDSDEVLYERAKQIVYERKCASASFLQRRMKIGYNRAARLIEMMEENGIIGPQNGSKPREILKYE